MGLPEVGGGLGALEEGLEVCLLGCEDEVERPLHPLQTLPLPGCMLLH